MESAHCAFISAPCLPSGTHAPFSENNAKILASSLKVRRGRVDNLVTGRAFIVTNLKRRPLSFATLYPEAVTQFLQAASVDLQQIREGRFGPHSNPVGADRWYRGTNCWWSATHDVASSSPGMGCKMEQTPRPGGALPWL